MDETQDFKSLQDQIQAALISTTRTSGQISSEDLGFQRSLNPELGTSLDEQSARLLALSGALLKSATSLSELRAPVLEDADDVESNWRNVVDVLDSLLEKTDTSLDEYTGVIKRKGSPSVEQVNLILIFECYMFKANPLSVYIPIQEAKGQPRKFVPYSEPRQTPACIRCQAGQQ